MALIEFIIKESATEPVITDFYDSLLGYFTGWSTSEYTPNLADYSITQLDVGVWLLHIDSNVAKNFETLVANSRDITYINPAVFGFALTHLTLNNNKISSSNLDSCINYWATTIIDLGDYLTNVIFNYTGNSQYRTSASDSSYEVLVNERFWNIVEALPPSPTPSITPSNTLTPTPNITPTPTHTPTTTHIMRLSVKTLAGAGVSGEVDGSTSNTCPVHGLPSTTPTATTSSIKSSNITVHTIAGIGRKGDVDGNSCAVAPTPSVTSSATPTPTPTSTHIPFLQVKTLAACAIPQPTLTATPTYTGILVRTVAGIGGEGSVDGSGCTFIRATPTPTRTPTVTPSITSTPSRTPETTPTSTHTCTPSVTVTCSLSPTPSLTPSITPTCSTHCVVVEPKVKEPCCEEPATILGYGSTTYNSKVTTYTKLANRIKSALGYPLIQLEVTDDQIYNFIDISLEFFTKFTGYSEEYLIFRSDLYKKGWGLPIGDLFSITPEMQNDPDYNTCSILNKGGNGYDIDLNDRRIVMNVFTVQPGDNSGINTLFTIEQTIAQQAYFGHLLGNIGFDLVTFDVLKIWLKTREKVLALKPYFRFYPEKQLLRLTPEPEFRSAPYFGIIGAYVQKPIRELISQLWIYKYTMAQIKVSIGNVRGKFSGTSLFGGQTVNYSDMMNQGIKEMEELEKELKTDLIDREPIPFFIG